MICRSGLNPLSRCKQFTINTIPVLTHILQKQSIAAVRGHHEWLLEKNATHFSYCLSTRDTHRCCRATTSQCYQRHRPGLTPSRTGHTPLGSQGISNPLGKATARAASRSRGLSTDLLVVVLWHVALSVVHHCYLLAVPGTETRSIHRTRPASARKPPAPKRL